ncbi:MAG: transposase [Pseudomonadota bacterium]
MTNEIKPKKEMKEPKVYNAHQRAQAVLAVWTERRRPAEICRQMSINSALLGQWQERAMAGMLEALQPRCRTEQQLGPSLAGKLERLLVRQTLVVDGKLTKLEKRLAKTPVEPLPTSALGKEK